VAKFHLFDLEGIAIQDTRLYAIGSLALYGENPDRERWERYQFAQMELEEKDGKIVAENLKHVAPKWPTLEIGSSLNQNIHGAIKLFREERRGMASMLRCYLLLDLAIYS